MNLLGLLLFPVNKAWASNVLREAPLKLGSTFKSGLAHAHYKYQPNNNYLVIQLKYYNLPSKDKEKNRDAEVRRGHVDPNIQRERWQEREQVRRLFDRFSVQYADPYK